jgi:hypothetical protein
MLLSPTEDGLSPLEEWHATLSNTDSATLFNRRLSDIESLRVSVEAFLFVLNKNLAARRGETREIMLKPLPELPPNSDVFSMRNNL